MNEAVQLRWPAVSVHSPPRSPKIELAFFVRVALISAGGVLALMLALGLWVRKAERTIRDRSQALLEANARLADLSRDLEKQVEDRSRRLVRAETLASLGTLSAGVAHEVNNPISGVVNLTMLMQRIMKRGGVPPERQEEFRGYLASVAAETQRVGRIVSDLLSFSRRSSPQRPTGTRT